MDRPPYPPVAVLSLVRVFPPSGPPITLSAIMGKGQSMDLKEAAAVARHYIEDLFAAEAPRDIRLEGFLYDDHLMIWSLTIGFALSNDARDGLTPARQARSYKIVRVSETDKAVLSIRDH
jgi:hypothetical protein